jgi:Protein of unknown function with HXXEE motif
VDDLDKSASLVVGATPRRSTSSLSDYEASAMTVVYWLPFTFVALHIVEEFVWPGGFLEWYRGYRPELAASLTPRFAIVVNAILLTAACLLGVFGPSWSRGVSLWLVLGALLGGNAIFHLVGVLRISRYSPGVITGLLLYVPLCVFGYLHFLATGEASWSMAIE